MFQGYVENPNATAEAIDKYGWVHSGDIGHFDSEGYLHIVDRKKDILKYKNFHVTPSEIEELIMELSEIKEVCVVGIPDEIYTDLPAAVVVITKPITEQKIIDYVAGNAS